MRLIDITDFQDPALDVYARISEGQLLNRAEPEKGMFIAESPKVIRRALQAGYQPVSFLVENRLAESNHETRELLEEWEGMDIPIYTDRIYVNQRNALCHVQKAASIHGRGLQGSKADRCFGKCREPDQCRRDLPLCSGTWHGRSASDKGMF